MDKSLLLSHLQNGDSNQTTVGREEVKYGVGCVGRDLSSPQAGQARPSSSLVALEELQGVRGVELVSAMRAYEGRSRLGKGSHRPGGRICVGRVSSGTALGGWGGPSFSQETAQCQEGGVPDSHQGELMPKDGRYPQ